MIGASDHPSPRRAFRRRLRPAAAALGAAAALLLTACGTASADEWIGAWGAAPQDPIADPAPQVFAGGEARNQTLRMVVTTTTGGSDVRVRLSNAHGAAPVTFGAARVARRTSGAAVDPATDRALTFDGRPQITVAPGDEVVSDAAGLAVGAREDLAVSVFVTGASGPMTWHASAFQTSYAAAAEGGDVTASHDGAPFTATLPSWYFVSGVDVRSPAERAGTVVALGDSITDGHTTPTDANARWPDVLARRLAEHPVGVLNAGIGGNAAIRRLGPTSGPAGEDRLTRDVLRRPGVRALVVALGTNDLSGGAAGRGSGATADEIARALRRIARRAHDEGLTVVGATVAPRNDGEQPFGWDRRTEERERRELNRWIRETEAFDAVADVDRALRDRRDPDRLDARYDSGDGLHPNAAGMEQIAAAVPLAPLLRERRR